MKDVLSSLNDSSFSDESPATVYPTSCHGEPWHRAVDVLIDNPGLITYHILCMSLKHDPPFSVIRYMLSLNPKAADVPKQGPSALQVAVKHKCSLDIVQLLIATCPMALVTTTKENPMDPVTYAKLFRPGDVDVIELLSLPLNHWTSDATRGNNGGDSFAQASYKPKETATEQREDMPHLIVESPPRRRDPPTESSIERQELNNVKALCAAVVKGQKRINKELELLQDKISHSSVEDAFRRLEERNEELGQEQLKALDLKEQAMLTHIRWMEHRFQNSLAIVQEGDQEMEFKLHRKLDQMMNIIDTEMRLLQGRLACLEHDLAQQGQKMDNLHMRHQVAPSQGSQSECHVLQLQTAPTAPTPVIFCSHSGNHYDAVDDDVRSLLSEDEIVPRGQQLCKASHHVSPLARMIFFCKEGFLL